MATRPDAAAIAQLGRSVVRPRFLVWLDIAGDPLRATTWPAPITPSGTGDADLDGFTFAALDPRLVNITLPNERAAGTDTVTASLSGLLLPDADLFAVIGDRANWQGRTARIWMAVCDEDGVQQGPIWALYTGKMSSLTIGTDASGGVIDLEIESYLATLAPASNRTYLDQEYFDPADQSAKASIACANGVSGSSLGLSGQAGGAGGGGRGLFGDALNRVF
jgi:hypothetical protein